MMIMIQDVACVVTADGTDAPSAANRLARAHVCVDKVVL